MIREHEEQQRVADDKILELLASRCLSPSLSLCHFSSWTKREEGELDK